MTPDTHQRLRQIFDAAVSLPPDGRTEYLLIACRGDEVLHQQIMALLAAHGGAAGFMEATPATQSLAVEGDSPAGGSVGPYKLLREVGRGGMGTVYQAVRADDTFRKIVAIKIMRSDMSDEVPRSALCSESHSSGPRR